jgi:hypothetical protein
MAVGVYVGLFCLCMCVCVLCVCVCVCVRVCHCNNLVNRSYCALTLYSLMAMGVWMRV